MRFIWYWEYNQKEVLKMFEVNRRVGEDRKKHPNKYPKLIFGAHWLGMEPKGFTIYEVDDPQRARSFNLFIASARARTPMRTIVKPAYVKRSPRFIWYTSRFEL